MEISYLAIFPLYPPSLQICANNTVQVGNVADNFEGPMNGHYMSALPLWRPQG